MKIFTVLFLSCVSVLAADTSIQILTTVRTNESGVVSTFDVFTRDGQTNLVRRTTGTSGTEWMQVHRFYYHGLLVGDFAVLPKSSSFKSKAGSPYTFAVTFGPTNEVKSALVSNKDGVLLEAFTATNGVFSPVDTSVIRKENEIVKQFPSSSHASDRPSDKFPQEHLNEKRKDE